MKLYQFARDNNVNLPTLINAMKTESGTKSERAIKAMGKIKMGFYA